MPHTFLRFPVISHGAEYLVMGYLMRRNILTYKAPPGNVSYDLICIHSDPRRCGVTCSAMRIARTSVGGSDLLQFDAGLQRVPY